MSSRVGAGRLSMAKVYKLFKWRARRLALPHLTEKTVQRQRQQKEQKEQEREIEAKKDESWNVNAKIPFMLQFKQQTQKTRILCWISAAIHQRDAQHKEKKWQREGKRGESENAAVSLSFIFYLNWNSFCRTARTPSGHSPATVFHFHYRQVRGQLEQINQVL